MYRKCFVAAVTLSSTLAALAQPAAAQLFELDFGSAELGEIRRRCIVLCFSDGGSGCTAGTLESLTVEPPFFIRGIRRGTFAVDLCNRPEDAAPVTLPAELQAGEGVIFDIDLVATEIGSADQDILVNDFPLFPALVMVEPAGSCPPSATDLLCLENERFTVRSAWRTRQGPRDNSPVVQNVPSNNSGLFYFFDEDNWEMLLKVLDGCPINDHFWVFYAATTNVEFTVTVTDTQEQEVRTYFNPLGSPATPVQDTAAFATCP